MGAVAPGARRGDHLAVDYGAPVSCFYVASGVDVISSDGQRVGKLEYVLADDQTSIFDGIVIDVATGPGGHRFVDAPEVSECREHRRPWSSGC